MDQFRKSQRFGTAPVFFTAISTILGAIMFLRFGFAVGNVGFIGTLAIILIGHVVTIPTAMAIAEIATNQKVEGGGEYYIISRSFGLVIGSTIGIALYLSQGISVAFYIMAFAESFNSLFQYIIDHLKPVSWISWILSQKQTIGIPALLGLTYIMLTKGANLGVKTLYVVVFTLAISLVAFFIGTTDYSNTHSFDPFRTIHNTHIILESGPGDNEPNGNLESNSQQLQQQNSRQKPDETNSSGRQSGSSIPIGFFMIFAIIFPAFTGMTAGVGLSGDLRNPGKSIPLGTLAGTLTGFIVYLLIAYKLTASASPESLVDTTHLVMAEIAWQGNWIIPLGLAAATISSALGSIMVAPRTLQAVSRDKIFPTPRINKWLSEGTGENDEPFNASVVTVIIAGVFIIAGALDGVAKIISMFFMVTYGSLCLISFLNHFAADPSYRPKFRSRWFLSLFGAIACFGLMFLMNAAYAVFAIIAMILLYFIIAHFNRDKKSMALIFQGVIFQFSRTVQVFLQKAEKEKNQSWRPSAIAISEDSFERMSLFEMLSWISKRYGFGTYIHQITGYLSRRTNLEAEQIKERLIKMAETSHSNIYIDTLISPSFTSSIAQVIQLPGIAGTDNNLLLFEFSKKDPKNLDAILENFNLIKSVDFDILILASSERSYGLRKEIHIWITDKDYQNANLMILLAFIIMGHKDWKRSLTKIYAVYAEESVAKERQRLFELIQIGQLPISHKNIQVIAQKTDRTTKTIIREESKDADLTILGFHSDLVKHIGKEVFEGYQDIGNILFVNTSESKEIK